MMSTQNIVRNPSDGFLDEIIRLKLKKPKSWNWELSTSKSSPHIMLPTIKLYNSKGKLLVEAKDNGMQRRSWHSSDIKPAMESEKINNISGFRDSIPRHLRKCKSDILEHNHKNNIPSKFESINLSKRAALRERASKERENLLRTSKSQAENSFQAITRNRTDALNENKKSSNSCENAINPKDNKTLNHLRKSRSDVLEGYKMPENENALRKNRSARDLPRSMQIRPPPYHKRTRSDDLFQRMMKYNEESIKRAIADGYRNFITPLGSEKSSETINDDVKLGNNKKKNRQNYTMEQAETVLVPNNFHSPEINHFTHKRYKTRTCSAGTLIISEESFNGSQRRRRRNKMSDGASTNDTKTGASGSFKKDNALESSRNTIDKSRVEHIRQASDPTSTRKKGGRAQKLPDRYPLSVDPTPNKQENVNEIPKAVKLFRSDSYLFKCEEIIENGTGNSDNNNCDDYTVQEPITPSSDAKERKLSGPIIEYLEKLEKNQRKKRRKQHKRPGQESGSSSTAAERNTQHNETGNNVKGRIQQASPKDAVGDATLLGLVRRLSSDHDKMGANVSRHSSKGLHGRRSQSSGSICNGKGRHASSSDAKMCGSLPSYLDERDSNTCNNNHHDCEKPPLDDVERIPPLGDAAPLHWKFSDTQAVLCDQGYGSERSPEEEYPPSLPGHDGQCPHHMEPHSCYPFITPESTFLVGLVKGSRGLGLSVTGGSDGGGSWPGLIRIKRLFPHQPAAACGLLNVGDLLLEVNGITLTGLTNYEALEVLRTTPNHVELRVCRPPPDVLSCVSPISEVPPPPPRRDPPTSLNLTPPPYQPTPEDDFYHGEFDITLTKIQGSLGFTLRKEDDSALGHYVRALVREPALSDGRIHAGDKIIAVNDVEISSMTHEQAVQYLRQAGDVVTLRLYRDAAQTPVSTLSPTETTPRASFSRKPHLRPEALDMLNDIAMRKIGNHDMCMRSSSPNASPRRLRRQPYSSDASQITDTSSKYLIADEQFHEGLFKKPSLPLEDGEDAYNSLFSLDSDDGDRPSRPSSLDLCNSKGTPVITRKPKFNFSLAHNAYELNNLDPEILDAPNLTYNLGKDDVKSTEVECSDSFPQEPVSMPHIPSDNPGFSYKNPAYQSAHPPCGVENTEPSGSADKNSKAVDESNMKKWKGVVFNADEEDKRERPRKAKIENEYEILAIELNRGWNSRLGFSLQGAAGVTYVSAVHADSVAAKDGRLKPGDRLIKVNDESVESMSTSEIIDLLRIVRGPVCIVVSRCKSNQDCTKSNAEN